MKHRATIHVTGIVQGVGFRPFVYRVASSLGLAGYVQNLGDAGVNIVVEGTKKSIKLLIKELENNHPSISRIDSLDLTWEKSENGSREFVIKESSSSRQTDTTPILPPDIATCEHCVVELKDSNSHWYQYAFTSCAACGPRFSTIVRLPYDRPTTTMIDFPLCNTCNTGYLDPVDRRYHAQTTACERCGPLYSLYDNSGVVLTNDNPISVLSKLIDNNAIVAVQGIGGTHIVTKVSSDRPIGLLRERKGRLERPFAVMVRDIETIRDFAKVSDYERKLLQSWRRPIVLLRKKDSDSQAFPKNSIEQVAPKLDTIGVMLPYSSLHHLLFQVSSEPAFVMTSANPTGVPMYIHPEMIIAKLGKIVDYFLVHNRRIHQRIDDSVLKPLGENHSVFIRRARGYVPEPFKLGNEWKNTQAIAVGPEEKTTGAILKNDRIYVTQHIGDADSVESMEFLQDALRHMTDVLDVKNIQGIACDLHPEFLSTEYAEDISSRKNIPLHRIQHHHAHLASLMVDSTLTYDTCIICITADGFGYGTDSKAWGGEVLLGDMTRFERKGGLSSSFHTGGDLAARFAARSFIGVLGDIMTLNEILDCVRETRVGANTIAKEDIVSLILEAQERKINTIETTSAGRFLDSAALALGICSENSYDGECPMKLEAAARDTGLRIEPDFASSEYGMLLDIKHSLTNLLELKDKGYSLADLAYAIQWHLGSGLAEIACNVADTEGIDYVGFSGGVALNHIITKAVVSKIRDRKLKSLVHRDIPPGDGGISTGQVATIAATMAE